jgi:hypothetical protein
MTTFDRCRSAFTALFPDLTRMAVAAFCHLDAEAQAEAVQNALALTWRAYHALILKGRGGEPDIIRNTLWYAIRQTRCGRRAEGESRAQDAYKRARRGTVQFQRAELRHFVSDDTPVPEAVSFRLDVPAFLATLSDRQQRMAESLMTGMRTKECADEFRVTPGAVSQFRLRFKELFEAYMAQ